jgi:hypothetical protein
LIPYFRQVEEDGRSNMFSLLLFAGSLLTFTTATKYVCPAYEAIRQPSVDPSVFDIHDIKGNWYLQATTEPTTHFCLCNVMNYTIETSIYRYTDTCFQDLSARKTWQNETVTLGGHLSTNKSTPGILHEGFVIANHSIAEKPNYLFNVTRDPTTGELTEMHFYACLGQILPFTKPLFSYLYYTREVNVPVEHVQNAVARDKALYDFDVENIVYTNATDWQTCGVL